MGCGATMPRRQVAETAAPPRPRPRVPAVLSHHFLLQIGDLPASETDTGYPAPHNPVYNVRWSPCGGFLISSARDGNVSLWSAAHGYRVRQFNAHRGFALSCTYSPLGNMFASTSDDRTAKIWNVESDEDRPVRVLAGHEHKVYASDFSADGSKLVTASMDRLLKMWDVETGTCTRNFVGHDKSVFSCACPHGDLIISGGDDRCVRVWDWRAQSSMIRVLPGHTKTVWSVRGLPGGESALSTGMDADVRDWDLGSGRCRQVFEGHKAPVHFACYYADGQAVASAGRDMHVRLWNRSTGECADRITGHEAAVYGGDVREDRIASCSLDETIRIWKLGEGFATPAGDAGLDLEFDFDIADDPADGEDPWEIAESPRSQPQTATPNGDCT
eukprot:TRINITY_DN42910_c0_g1_i1.p1 TRINITY_DN42910_c0_g1~~TRINITY_DN42910_c0_g1_i1.p1  ORF type:complete len:387 (+),score=54.09 TRINITY_DN42910_c0_g1_i1:80-1240(+)